MERRRVTAAAGPGAGAGAPIDGGSDGEDGWDGEEL